MAFSPLYRTSRPFSLLNGVVDPSSASFRQSLTQIQPLIERFEGLLSTFRAGGGDRAISQHTVRNKKLLARDRLARLMDKGEFTELFRFAGYEQAYGNIPSAGNINAVGRIKGKLCFVIANDATVKGGTIYPISLQKQLRQQELSLTCRLPLIYLVDSGGAFLPLQADIFPDKEHGGRSFFMEANMEAAGISQLSMVCGSCTAGGAYVPMMCEEVTMVSGIGHVFLGGPPLVQAALGEIVSAEDLGGAALHSNVSGCSDHFARDEVEGLAQLRAMMETLPEQRFSGANRTGPQEPLFCRSELPGLAPNLRTADRDLNAQILSRLLDGSSFFEFKKGYGHNLTAGFGRLRGRMVGWLASCGPISAKDALKGSHFVQLCQQRSVPLVQLCHTEEDPATDPENPEDAAICLRAKASLFSSLSTFSLPKVAVVTGAAVGWDAVAMGSRALCPDFLFAWPNARFGHSGDVTIDAFSAAGNVQVDDVIKPQDTRDWLDLALEICHVTSKDDAGKRSAPKSVMRF